VLGLGQLSFEGKPVADGAHADWLVEFEQRGWPPGGVLSCADLVGEDELLAVGGLAFDGCRVA